MPRNPKWSRDELILALDVYLRHGTGSSWSQHIVELSSLLNRMTNVDMQPDPLRFRNPNGVGMKLANFARLDPSYLGTGLTRGGRLEVVIWRELANNKTALAAEVARITSGFIVTGNPLLEAVATIEHGSNEGKGGQGFQGSFEERKAVEDLAMKQATKWYRFIGWFVTDVSQSKSYDLVCHKAGKIDLHVEVKGTTGDGSRVLLTPNEVKHARAYEPVDLYVLHDVVLRRDEQSTLIAEDGEHCVYDNWNIDAGVLEPIGYSYSPPS